jgi:LysR family nitrogen assimilation transcriptional regulator
MDLKQLRAFVTVADTGSVTRAAHVLRLVQPAVSRQLRLLEEDLGADLFDRSRHGMQLTAQGKTMLEYARRILNEVERARAEIQPTDGPVSGVVSVGLLASVADLLATSLTAAVRARYPKVHLRLIIGYAGELADQLEKGDVDIALLYGQKDNPSMHVKALLEESLWVVASASTGLSMRRPMTMHQVAAHPFIFPSPPQGLRATIERAALQAGVTLQIAAETNDLKVQKALVAEGLGWTMLPAVCVKPDVERKQLSAAPLKRPGLRRSIVLAASTTCQSPIAVRRVIATVTEQVKRAFDDGHWGEDARWIGR